MPPTIFTIGHGRAAFAALAQVLASHGAATIVDVRSHPHSRHAPEFSRPALDELAAAHGFGYRWMGEGLGGKPADPTLWHPDGSLDKAALRLSPRFCAALAEAGALARGGRVVLLCAEEYPGHCHRSRVIAPALEEAGFQVVHLLHDGTALAHQGSLGF
jgi:uncharacterized protein (DUF488 family)